MNIKIFWKEDCPNCPPAKELGKKLELEEGMDVAYYDTGHPDGLAEATMFDVMSTPSVIVCDEKDQEVSGWRGSVPKVQDIKALI